MSGRNSKLLRLVVCALMIALSFALSFIAFKLWPNGGSVTLASMVPIVVIGMMYTPSYSLLAAFVYSLLQMVAGFYPPPVQNFSSYLILILFDYILAFGVLGLYPLIIKIFRKNNIITSGISAGIVILLRYGCHIVSGITIWKDYAPVEQGAFLYSLIYNGTYMIPEMVITVVVVCVMYPFLNNLIAKHLK